MDTVIKVLQDIRKNQRTIGNQLTVLHDDNEDIKQLLSPEDDDDDGQWLTYLVNVTAITVLMCVFWPLKLLHDVISFKKRKKKLLQFYWLKLDYWLTISKIQCIKVDYEMHMKR